MSITHKTLDQSIIRRNNILNPIFEEFDEIVRRYVNIYNKKMKNMSFVVY